MRQRPWSRLGYILIATFLALLSSTQAVRFVADTDRFPGWHGELPSASLGTRNSSGAEQLAVDVARQPGGSQAPLLSAHAAGAQVMARSLQAALFPADSPWLVLCRQPCQMRKPVRLTRLSHTQVHKWDGRVEEIAWTPRAFRLTGFLGEHEVTHLIQKASGPLVR